MDDFWIEISLPTGLSTVSWALSGRKGIRKPLQDSLVTKFRPNNQPTNPGKPLNHICEPSHEDWWLHLYVMLSRATSMEDMLLLRPPPRERLEAGPPRNVKAALERFRKTIDDNRKTAEELARSLGFSLD